MRKRGDFLNTELHCRIVMFDVTHVITTHRCQSPLNSHHLSQDVATENRILGKT